MKIGNVEINGKQALAPMAGISDRAFREICALLGASYFTSEMVSVKGLIYGSKKTFLLTDRGPLEKPFAIQLFGSVPEDFYKAIKLLEPCMPEIIDINMGCPATKIIKENSGCALMKSPKLCGEIVEFAKKASSVPVTVKIRSGWNAETINAAQIAKICENAGADAITVHGRTKEQGYSGTSNREIIAKVKSCVKIPVIGNGDITNALSARDMIESTGCDMVAVGRAAMGNPWIFSEIDAFFRGVDFTAPSLKEKSEIMKKHIEKICLYKSETAGIKEARKHISAYIKDIPGAAELRQKAFKTQNKNELFELCDEIGKIEIFN